MLRRLLLFTLLLFTAHDAMALQYAFAIRFTNKRHTQGLTDTLSYLTQRSLNRRHKYHIAIDSTDYPVNPAYIDSVLQVSGTRLHLVSRWLNLCVVLTTDTASVQALASKPFVQQVLLVGTYIGKLHRTATNAATGTAPAAKTNAGDAGYYGKTWAQTALLQGQALHDKGYTGHNQLIAVFDAGFLGVDTHPAFDSLYQSGRIVDVHNFTYDTSYVYGYDNHGTRSLSTMAAYVPDTFVGAAPLASYALYVTEDNTSEQPIEMYNLLAACERADSLGADIISCSLGYNEFDPPHSNLVFATQLDGKTTVAAQAANWATTRGILFVASAGNEGGNAWGKVLTPGDADSALTVGSVDIGGVPATSSGYGPNAAGQVKPDVCGLGHYAAVVNGFSYDEEDGTSFSTPQIAGWAACLAEAAPMATPAVLRYALTNCASTFANPGIQLGYGIPNLDCSGNYLGIGDTVVITTYRDTVIVGENPVHDLLILHIVAAADDSLRFRLLNMAGSTVLRINSAVTTGDNFFYYPDAGAFPAGMYLLQINGERIRYTIRLVKW